MPANLKVIVMQFRISKTNNGNSTQWAIIPTSGKFEDKVVAVAEVAKQYGGGGHRNASGFKVSFAAAAAFEV